MITIAGKKGVLHKLVYEVRYRQGFIYLDRCGITANRIMSSNPEWILRGENVNPQSAPLVSILNGAKAEFNALKYNFSIEQQTGGRDPLKNKDVNAFSIQADSAARIIEEELELREFTRVGFRAWFMFGCDSEEDVKEWVMSLGAFTINPRVFKTFDGCLESESHVVLLRTSDRKLRIAVSNVERLEQMDLGGEILALRAQSLSQKQREMRLKQEDVKQRILANPQYAAMIDVDVFVENPISTGATDYITQSFDLIREKLPFALSER